MSIVAALFLVLLYVLLQWFLCVTDLLIAYNWRFDTFNGVHLLPPKLFVESLLV